MTDQGKEKSPIPSKRIKELAKYAEREILDPTKKPDGVKMSMFISEWYPSYRWNTEPTIEFIYENLENIGNKFAEENGRKPVMIDLGSGEGMIPFIASATGKYKHCWGIEFRKEVAEWGKTHQKNLESNNIIPNSNVTLAIGSYYTQETWNNIGEEVLGKDYNDPRNTKHALEESNLLDGNKQLMADVVYWYPSDPYLELGADQWKGIFKKGTYLILGPSGQIDTMESAGILDGFDLIGKTTREVTSEAEKHTFRNLYIYKKK